MLNITSHQGNANTHHDEMSLLPLGWPAWKNQITINNKSWQGCGEIRNFIHSQWVYKRVQLLWKPERQFLKCLNIELPYDPAILLLVSTQGKQNFIFPHRNCTWTFVAALFIKAKKWKQPKCPSTDEWIHRMLYIYTMKYYSTIKRNGVLIHVTMWMNLINVMLSERSQSQKITYYMILSVWSSWIGKSIETGSRWLVA